MARLKSGRYVTVGGSIGIIDSFDAHGNVTVHLLNQQGETAGELTVPTASVEPVTDRRQIPEARLKGVSKDWQPNRAPQPNGGAGFNTATNLRLDPATNTYVPVD
jgi:hypothetical protein